jgi:hypothetical protein
LESGLQSPAKERRCCEKNVTIQPADIREAIEGEDDFRHEMRVGHILRNLHTPTITYDHAPVVCEPPEHGATYTDPITRKPRQFDYRYRMWREVSPTHDSWQCVLLAVECKNLNPSFPLVVSGRERTEEEAYHTYIESVRDGGGKGMSYSFFARKTGRESRIYAAGDFVGKQLSRLKPSKDRNGKQKLDVDTGQQSDIYERWSQAVASSQELATNARSFAKVYSVDKYCSFIMPVVVVPDESLWKVTYDATGTFQGDPVQTNDIRYFVATPFREDNSNSPPWFILTNIHFVTMTGFKKLLSTLVGNSEGMWDKMFPTSISNLKMELTGGGAWSVKLAQQ